MKPVTHVLIADGHPVRDAMCRTLLLDPGLQVLEAADYAGAVQALQQPPAPRAAPLCCRRATSPRRWWWRAIWRYRPEPTKGSQRLTAFGGQ